jgi:hypothetical protein
VLVRVKEQMEKPVGVPLRAFKSQVTSALHKRYGNPALNIWTPGYHDFLLDKPELHARDVPGHEPLGLAPRRASSPTASCWPLTNGSSGMPSTNP